MRILYIQYNIQQSVPEGGSCPTAQQIFSSVETFTVLDDGLQQTMILQQLYNSSSLMVTRRSFLYKLYKQMLHIRV